MKPKLLVSSSVSPFREKAEKIWGLERYKFPQDILKPTVFFGMYHIGDYFHYLIHQGESTIFWCGYDIKNLKVNFFGLKVFGTNTKHYVENELEQKELASLGIESEIKPSFLEDVNDFPISFKPSERTHVWMTALLGREKEYGVDVVTRIAPKLPDITFHIYGVELSDIVFSGISLIPHTPNIIWHGKIPQHQFNKSIRGLQAGIRLNVHNGFSETIAKSVFLGQYPISRLKYSMIDSFETEDELIKLLKDLKNKREPNFKAREYYIRTLNNFPWMK